MRGSVGKLVLTMCLALLATPVFATTKGRGLPESSSPHLIEGVYRVGQDGGEIHFTKNAELGKSAFLRVKGGAVCGLERVEGGRDCLRFPELSRRERSACLFVFDSGSGPCGFKVNGAELKEATLFGSVKSLHRSRYEEEFSAQ